MTFVYSPDLSGLILAQSIATAAEEQAATSEEINKSIDEINAIAGQTDELADASLAAIRRLEELAVSLSGLINELKDQSAEKG